MSTHTVKIEVIGMYPDGERHHASVSVSGDGGIDHMIDTFAAALVAAGFSADTASRLGLIEQ
jgi:hypothetical protein